MKPTSPCVSLLLSLLATVAGITTASASETYSADGVNLENILESTRFYDTDKGLYWKMEGQPYRGAQELYKKSLDFSFLGELQSRIKGELFVPSAFDDLVHDGNSCWYCVGANMIQYWESYYGVFYKGEAPLPYGYTYDTDNLTALAGTQSLDLHMFFYDNWTQEDRDGRDAGGDAEMAAVWYLSTGKNIKEDAPGYSQLVDGAAEAGFFSEYFTGNAASREAYYIGGDATDLISATDFLREAFGFDREGNHVTYGQIAYLGVVNKLNQGHALTCYGFTTGENGKLESLYLTNSDDKEYKMTRVYVGWDGQGHLHLYEDAAHTKGWMLFGDEWDICDITYINTPSLLKEMYDEYTHAALTWTGARSAWSDRDAAEATTEVLPGADSGWQVFALDDYYDSYYQEGRKVAFTDLASKTSVALQGKLATPELRLTNNTKAYTFTGSGGATLRADDITKQGSADAAFRSVAITANTVDVDMGALILGTGATLTAQTGEVDDMGTLQLAGGKASFTGGLEIFSSGTLAVTAASQLTTTLTLEGGSFLYFNAGSANTASPLLTLTGDLNVLGDCSLLLNEKALTIGKSYILMNVTGKADGWKNITTNCGELTLSGSRLILDYWGADKLTWTGGSGKWSKALWDGGSADSAGADVTFSHAGTATITVVGTVSPNSITFTQGTYNLVAGENALVSGCRTITLGDGVTIHAAVPLTGGNISMESGSTLHMELTTPASEITGLEMAPGSTVVFHGATRYMVDKAGALGGHIELHDTTSLVVGSSLDTELYGTFSGDAGAAIVLMNSSEGHPVTFYMGQDSGRFKGSVTIGTDDDAPLTTLRMGSAARNFTITGNGELSLRGRGEITGYMTGTGMLTIEHDATYQLAPGGKVSFGNQIVLNVAGSATAGTATDPLKAELQDKIIVSGDLTAYFQAEQGGQRLALKELTLSNGGSYTLVHLERTMASLHTIDKLAVDGGGILTNSIIDVEQETIQPQFKHDITIGTLSGSGTLELNTSSDLYVTKTIIEDTAPGGYDGDLLIVNPHYYKVRYYANYDHGQVVEMKSGTVKGAVRLEAHGMMSSSLVNYGMAGFGVGGDITVGGIDDGQSSKTTYLYSGSYAGSAAAKDPQDPLSFAHKVAPEKHTLTINAAAGYEFRGKVFAWLSLVKQGIGTQTFSGDTSDFEGALRVDAGELVFEKGIYLAEGVTLNGGTLRLHGGSLKGLQGAASGTGGTLALEAAAYDIDLTGAGGKYAVQLNGAAVTLTGDTATLPGLGSALTAAGGSSITVASGKALALQSAISNSGTLTLKGTIDASNLEIVKNDDTHVDTSGKLGDSGFAKKAGIAVTIVNGGTTIDNGATITHRDWQYGGITLGRDGKAGTGGEVDYTTYLLTGTDTATVSAITTAAGGKLRSIQVEGGTLTVDAASDLVTATGGMLNATSAGTLGAALSGTAALTTTANVSISRANSHSGGTTVKGGTLHIGNKAALGTGKVSLTGGTLEIAANGFTNAITASNTGAITVTSGNALTLQKAIENTGTLTIKGKLDASALAITGGGTTHVDINDQTGNSGFTKTFAASVTVVDGGTTVGKDAIVVHNDLTLTLGSDGKATTGESKVDYTTYLLTGTDTANVAAITRKAGGKLKAIQVEGGTLTVDTATNLITATGGKLDITTTGTVGGTARNTAITATAGTLNTALSGSSTITAKGNVTINRANTHTGNTAVIGGKLRIGDKAALGTGRVSLTGGTLEIAANGFANTVSATGDSAITVAGGSTLALKSAIANTGTLTMKGALDASALTLEKGDTTHVDINGKTGDSGFEQTGGYSVTIVDGGKTVNNGATVTHKDLKLTLGADGKATAGGSVDYSAYLLAGWGDTASVTAINKAAGNKLKAINLQNGTLTVDAATDKLNATGGKIEITKAVNVGGKIADAIVTASAGTMTATIGGSSRLDVAKGSKVTVNNANTYTGGTTVYDSGVLRIGNAKALGSGDVHLSCGTLEIAANGFDNKITSSCSGSVVSVERGYTLALNQTIENLGTVTLKGAFDASALKLTQDGVTHLDVNGNTGDSGFTKTGGASVTIVSGGTTKNGGTTITHSGLAAGETLVLGSNGTAVSGGSVDYATYLLTGRDSAGLEAITKMAGNKLRLIDLQGGTLEIAAARGTTLARGVTLNMDGGTVNGLLIVGNGSTLVHNGGSFTTAPELRGGTLDMGGKASLTVTGTRASVTLGRQNVNLTAKGTVITDEDLVVKGGTVTLNALDGYKGDLVVEGGSTLRISTVRQAVDNAIIVNGSASVTNGTTHSGNITVNGDLLRGSTIKLIDKDQLVTLNSGAMSGNISGTGRVDVDGSVDITQGQLTAEQVYLNGTLTHTRGWTLGRNQTLTLGGGKVVGNLVVGNNSTLDFNGYTLADAPELRGGTLDMGGKASLTVTGTRASVTLGRQGVNLTAKGTVITDDDMVVKGGTVTLNALDGYKGDLVAEGGSTLRISTVRQAVENDIIVNGSASVTNGTTHSGNITVNGDLLRGSTIKLIEKNQLVTLNGGTMSGSISGIGRVDVDGSVDITQGQLTAEQVYLNGTLTHTRGWTLGRNQTLTLGGGKVVGNLVVGNNSTLDFNGHTLADAPELRGGTLDMGGKASLTVTGTRASVTLGRQGVNLTAKGTVITDDDMVVKGGTVTLNALDGYKGDLVAEGGSTLRISTVRQAVDNAIIVNGSASVTNGTTHSGNITVNGDLLRGSTIKLIEKGQLVTLNGGAMSGNISGIGRVDVDGSVDITQGQLTAEQVYLNGTLTHTRGWTLGRNQTLTLGGGKVVGNLVVGNNSTLDFNGYTLADAPELRGGTLDMGGKASLTITGSRASVTLGRQGVNLTAKGTVITDDDMVVKGGTVTLNALDGYMGDLVAEGGSTLRISTVRQAVDNAIIVNGSASVTNGTTHSGNITVNGDLLRGSTIKLIEKDQLVTLNSGAMSGNISGIGRVNIEGSVDFSQGQLTAEQIYVNEGGRLANTKAWNLAKGQTLAFAGGGMEVGAKGLSTAAGSTLLLQRAGTLNGSLTLGGGELVYYGNSTLTVTGTLTLSRATTLTMTGDLVKGKTYTLFTCSDIVTPTKFDAATFFNTPDDVVVDVTATAITATYNGQTKHSSTPSTGRRTVEPEETEEEVGEELPTWDLPATANAPAATPAMAGEELPEVEETTSEPARADAVPEAAVPDPLAAVADALVQADWGVVNAQHAFTGTLNGRHQSLRAIGTGRTAVWADAIASHTRQSSAHGHAGSDNTLYGAAFGVEFNAGEHGAAGVAIGHTWNRVETFGMGRVKQDTQHAGAFGRARVFSRGANSLWLEAAAGYGKTESRGTPGYSRERWTQNAGTLTVHANDVMYISETTALNYFGGLEYMATDSARIGGVGTGSVQNLRGEIGAGVTHAIGHGTVFAEAALTGDMVRHNPQAAIGEKYRGANPGRIGAGITVGGAYAISDHWSVNATYSFQGAKHNNSHNAGVGATFRF